MITENKQPKQLKKKYSNRLQKERTDRTIKRFKKMKTRRMYYSGAGPQEITNELLSQRTYINDLNKLNLIKIMFTEFLLLKDVTNDDPRIVNFMKRPYSEVVFDSQRLTQIPYFNKGQNKVTLTIIECESLVSISYRGIHRAKFYSMSNITTDILARTYGSDCTTFVFSNCRFSEDCEFSSSVTDLTFFLCDNIPQISNLLLTRLCIVHCRHVTFPIFHSYQYLFQGLIQLIVKDNEYINDVVKYQFINYLDICRKRKILVESDLPVVVLTETLILDNVTNDDPRIVNFMDNPSSYVEFRNSPRLTRIPYFNKGGIHKVEMHISYCDSLESISHRGIDSIIMHFISITTELMVSDYHKDCKILFFYSCIFEPDCKITPHITSIYFDNCINIPRMLNYPFIEHIGIENCANVNFPILNPDLSLLRVLVVIYNEYINNDVKDQFINLVNTQIMLGTDVRSDLYGGPTDFETLSHNNGWVPPPPTWGNYVPRTNQCDITMDTLIVDYIHGEMTLRDYIDENTMDPNIVFLKCNRDYIVFDLTRIQNDINKYGIDNSVIAYECMSNDNKYGDDSTIVDKPFFKLGEVTSSTRSYTPLNQIEHIINHPEHKFWECYHTGIKMASVVSHSIKSGSTVVNGSHCQSGQEGVQFHVRKLIVSDEVDIFVSENTFY